MKNSPHSDEYTVVLGSRTQREGFAALNVKKETRSVYARGSPRDHPPPHALRSFRGTQHEDAPPSFGFDVYRSYLARTVARTLITFLMLQPVYVAFGMELGDEVASSVEKITVVEETDESGVAQERNFANDVEGTPTSTDENDESEEVLVGGEKAMAPRSNEAESVTEETLTTEDETNDAEASDHNLPVGAVTEEGESAVGDLTDASDMPIEEVEGEEVDSTEQEQQEPAEVSEEPASGGEDSGSAHGAGDELVSDGAVEESVTERATSTDAVLLVDNASSTEEVEEIENTTIATEQHAGNKYVFGEADCTVVSDGEFYCTKKSGQAVRSGRTHVYAQLDREGDREIFLARGGGIEQVTDNMIDDFAPVFDEETGRIAWHSSIEDRLQILFRDPARGTVQVTRGDENNSNPTLSGDKLVWQGWRGNDWEIFLAQHLNGDIVVEQLTTNDVHDMFPQVRGSLISWQEEREGGAVVVVYDIETGEQTLLDKDGAGKYENPRFMLVFESKDENGDVATIGYDVVTGEEVELGTTPNKNTVPVPQTPADHTGDAVPVEATTASSSVKTVRNEGEGE